MKLIWLSLIVGILFLSSASAWIDSGVIINLTPENVSMTFGAQAPVDTLGVYTKGWLLNTINYTFENTADLITFTSWNWTESYTKTNVVADANCRLNWTVSGLPPTTYMFYDYNSTSNSWAVIDYTPASFYTNITTSAKLLWLTNESHTYLTFPSAVQGIVKDINHSWYFNSTSITLLHGQLATGYVQILLNTVNYTNWSQFYEFINDGSNTYDDVVGLVNNSDTLYYIKVLDYSNSPVKDAVVRAYQVYPGVNPTNYSFIGQRLTSDLGYTYFQFDSLSQIYITVTKDGYTMVDKLIIPADETRSSTSTSLIISLRPSSVGGFSNFHYWIPNYYYGEPYINISFYAPGFSSLWTNTTYNPAQYVQTINALDQSFVSLAMNTHYLNESNFSVCVYLDTALYDCYPIIYRTTVNELGEIPAIDAKYLRIGLFIAVILMAAMASVVFALPTVGFHVFMMGAIVIGLVSTGLLYLSFFAILYYIIQLVKGVIKSE